MAYKYRYKKNKEKILTAIIIFLLILIGTLAYFLISPQVELANISALPELSTFGYSQVSISADVVGDRGVITLTGDCYQVTAYTEVTQAESIANGLAGRIGFRPNAHDLMKSIFDSLGIQVVMVKIVEIRNNTYIGKLILRQGNRVLSLDSRPSDGTALAVRTNSPIYMKEDLLKAGKYIC
jgi:bifunctional DNase/RNase